MSARPATVRLKRLAGCEEKNTTPTVRLNGYTNTRQGGPRRASQVLILMTSHLLPAPPAARDLRCVVRCVVVPHKRRLPLSARRVRYRRRVSLLQSVPRSHVQPHGTAVHAGRTDKVVRPLRRLRAPLRGVLERRRRRMELRRRLRPEPAKYNGVRGGRGVRRTTAAVVRRGSECDGCIGVRAAIQLDAERRMLWPLGVWVSTDGGLRRPPMLRKHESVSRPARLPPERWRVQPRECKV